MSGDLRRVQRLGGDDGFGPLVSVKETRQLLFVLLYLARGDSRRHVNHVIGVVELLHPTDVTKHIPGRRFRDSGVAELPDVEVHLVDRELLDHVAETLDALNRV
ncbi:hypothetical protein ACFQH8_19705 [Halomicroarcula sp. GCM10025710]